MTEISQQTFLPLRAHNVTTLTRGTLLQAHICLSNMQQITLRRPNPVVPNLEPAKGEPGFRKLSPPLTY